MAFWKRHKPAAMLILLALLVLLPLLARAETGYVNTAALILRSSASRTSAALQTLPKGTAVNITGSSGDWYKVTYGKYKGYVLKQYITRSGTSAAGKTGTNQKTVTNQKTAQTKAADAQAALKKKLNSIGKPKACAPGTSGSNVSRLPRCLQALGYYKGKIDGNYGTATKNAVMRLQRAYGLTASGVATRQTIGAMFGQKLEEDYVTERLDWFSNVYLIPKGAVFTVKDCRTGKTFQCKRWSGANHLDAMPLTKADTAVMRSLYGQWSWRRRPILVRYNGHVYAASMNGMPHGTSTISRNNFDGHFCIHFYGSKTHGTGKVDSMHQKCVAEAMKHTW